MSETAAKGREEIARELEQTIMTAVSELFQISAAEIAPSSKLREDFELDSIDLFDLLGKLEQDTGLSLTPKDFAGKETISDIALHLSGLFDDQK